jgi:cytochrome c
MSATNSGLLLAVLLATTAALAQGDVRRGEKVYEIRCIACHSIDSNRVGPAHRVVFGRQAGTVPGYDYSAALRSSALVWNSVNLDRWLTNPEALIPGQKMGYFVSDPRDRADLIAYLKAIAAERRP